MQTFTGLLYAKSKGQNAVLSGYRAMPMKDMTSDGDSSFAMNRRVYFDTFSTTEVSTENKIKKQIYGNKDASQVTANRRVDQLANGSMNTSGGSFSYTTKNDANTQRNALHRVRNGGSVAPAQKTHKYTNAPIFY